MSKSLESTLDRSRKACHAVVIWIDWYAYHIARFEGLQEAFGRSGQVKGIELVGGIGVHAGLRFREDRPSELSVETLFPQHGWANTSKVAMALKLWRELSKLDAEIVLVPGYYTLPAIAAAMWARLHGRDSVLMTESSEDDHRRTAWKEALKSAVIRFFFDWAITGGAAHVRYLVKLRFPIDKILRFYDVVGNARITEATSAMRYTATADTFNLPAKYFLFVGRLAPEKNVTGLLRAWIDYRANGGSWALVFAGDGTEAAELRALLSYSPWSDGVMFAGHKTSEELLPYFSFARCLVLPSTREPWGLVVNEAMAASLPVIVASRCGCAEDLVVPLSNGFVFDVSRAGSLTACLHSMERQCDKSLAAMGEASLDRIQPYSPLNFGREIASISASVNNLHVAADSTAETAV